MLNDTNVASAGSYIRTSERIRNSKKIATIRDFHQNICVNPTIIFIRCRISCDLSLHWRYKYKTTWKLLKDTIHDREFQSSLSPTHVNFLHVHDRPVYTILPMQ